MKATALTSGKLLVCLILFCFVISQAGLAADEPSPELMLAGDSVINYVQWATADGGNGHWYAVLALEQNWSEAADFVDTLLYAGTYGHLATIESAEEGEFIRTSVTAGTSQPGTVDLFWLGGTYNGVDWAWSTGETITYTNWADGEPSDPGVESAIAMWGPNGSGDAGTWIDADQEAGQNLWWAIIEWGDGSCCGKFTNGYTGNTDCDTKGRRNLSDVSRLIDRVYISKSQLCCEAEGNTTGTETGHFNLAAISKLIDHVYVSKRETAQCN